MAEDENRSFVSKIINRPMLVGLVVGILGALLIWNAMPSHEKTYEDVTIAVEHVDEPAPAAEDHAEAVPVPASEEHAATTTAPVQETAPAPSAAVSMVAEVAVVIADMGLNRRVTEAAAKALPAEATMAISAYATDPGGTAAAFKATGRDVWLQIAAQSMKGGFDPGPLAVSGSMAEASNIELLKRQIGTMNNNIIGIYVPNDADITTQPDMWRDIATELIGDNMMIMDGTNAKVATSLYMQKSESKISAYLKTDQIVSAADGPAALQKQLIDAIPAIISAQQSIVVIINPSVTSMETVGAWVNSLHNKGIRLVPASRFTGLTGK